MLQFFFHKKFWLPLLLLATLLMTVELLLRAGFYDNWLSPDSLIKRSIDRKIAMSQFGYENIHWITLGDSRTDWGIKHQDIQQQQSKHGFNHVRLSFGRSGFPSYQALSQWSLHNLPNLQGVLMGMPMSNFHQNPNLNNQKPIVWAFQEYLPPDYKNLKPTNQENPFSNAFNNTYLSAYLPDIKDLARRLSIRLEEKMAQSAVNPNELFTSDFKNQRNVCPYQLNTLQACQLSAHKLTANKKLTKVEQRITKHCHKNAEQDQLDDTKIATFVDQWHDFFRHYLDNNVSVVIMLLPKHPIFDYLHSPIGTEEIYQQVVHSFVNEPHFRVIDLRHVFTEKNLDACSVYTDMVHFNAKGRELVSEALIQAITSKPLK